MATKKAQRGILTSNQFFFDVRHPYANAKKKLPCLKRLPEFTLGLTQNIDKNGNKIDEFFLPMSLRVEDSSVEKSKNGDVVDFIFAKDASMTKYDSMLVADKRKTIQRWFYRGIIFC